MRILLALVLAAVFVLYYPTIGFSQFDRMDEKIYESFKAESILLDSEKLESIREKVKLAVLENCEFRKASGQGRLHIAAIDIAAQLGLDTKIDESLAPRIESALKTIPCLSGHTSNETNS